MIAASSRRYAAGGGQSENRKKSVKSRWRTLPFSVAWQPGATFRATKQRLVSSPRHMETRILDFFSRPCTILQQFRATNRRCNKSAHPKFRKFIEADLSRKFWMSSFVSSCLRHGGFSCTGHRRQLPPPPSFRKAVLDPTNTRTEDIPPQQSENAHARHNYFPGCPLRPFPPGVVPWPVSTGPSRRSVRRAKTTGATRRNDGNDRGGHHGSDQEV